MILLLLGLAIVLTTSSSLLVAYRSGRGGNGENDPQSSDKAPHSGEISGSISITASGEVWLTVLIDELSILAKLDVVKRDQCDSCYRLSVAAVESPSGSWGSVSPHVLPLLAGQNRIVECTNPEEASSKIIELFEKMGVVISADSLRSIPYAITCGWKAPDECQRIVDEMLEDQAGE